MEAEGGGVTEKQQIKEALKAKAGRNTNGSEEDQRVVKTLYNSHDVSCSRCVFDLCNCDCRYQVLVHSCLRED